MSLTSLVETHIHLNFDSYDADRDAVLERARAVGIRRLINPGVDAETSRAAVDLAAKYPGVVYAAVGWHPNSTAGFSEAWLDQIRALVNQPGVVSIGEIGLDYHWDDSPKADQFRAFEAQLALAAELALPVIIHNREASEDVVPILERWAAGLSGPLRERPGVLHSVSAPQDLAERALAAGFYLGFTGPITYKNAEQTRRLAASMPLDRMLVETDGPFLTPIPYRGKRNEPAYIPYIIERIAALRGVSVEEIAQATTTNAERLFQLAPEV